MSCPVVIEIITPGPRGPRGLSAYEVAVAEGFVGTEAEWLASLQGTGGPGGATDLSIGARTVDTVVLESSTGADATLPAATNTQAGLATASLVQLVEGAIQSGDARLDDAREWIAATVPQLEAEGGSSTTRRAWTAERVFQAIAAWWAASPAAGKLATIASGATANASDAELRDRQTHTGEQAISTITGLTSALGTKADLVGGVIPSSQIPAIAISEYLGAVGSQSAMLALSGQRGDWCVRTDGAAAGAWILAGEPSSLLANWIQLPTPGAAGVSSVNGQTGPVTLGTGDIAESGGNLYFTAARAIGSALTGFTAGAGTVAATDTILQAIQKIVANLSGKANTGAIGSSGLTMATARLLGRGTAGSGEVEEISIGSGLALTAGVLTAPGGSGSSVFANVKDFGAVGDGVTDDTVAIQAAINSGKVAYVPEGIYRITATLTLDRSYQALIGSESRPIIRKTNAGAAIRVIATAANPLNLYSVVANLNLENTSTPVFRTNPTLADAGIVLDGNTSGTGGSVKYTRIENIRISNWSVGYYANDVVNGCVKNVYAHLLADFSAVGGYTSNDKFVGFMLECTPFSVGGVSPQASNEYVRCDAVGLRTPTNVQSIGFYVVGTDVRDTFFRDCECAVTSIGWHVKSTGGNDFNWNIQISRPIIDAFKLYGIWIEGLTGPGCVTINGGYIVGTGSAASHAIYILNSNGVTVTGGTQILGHANNLATDMGVRIEGGGGHSIVGNSFQNLNYPITLINSAKLCTIMGNCIFASATDTEASPTLNEAIRLLSGCEENTVIGNTIRGKDNTDTYDVGISVGAGCPRNMITGNVIDEDGTVATPYSITDTTTTMMTMGMVQSGRRLVFRGNDVAYPFEFQNASGTVIARIDATGQYTPPSGGGGGTGTKTLAVFTPRDNQAPATNFATLDQRNGISVLEFDANTDESAVFVGVIREGANLASGLLVRIWFMGDTATSGNVRWSAAFECSGTDMDADSFDTATEVTSAANGTSGIESIAEITCTTIDNLLQGNRFRLRITRRASDATNDTMAGDAQLVAVEVRQVA